MEASVSPLEATAAQTRAAVAPVDRARVETHASAASGREAPRRAEPAPAAGKKLSAADFDYGSILGAGSFGNVFHVRLHGSNQEYAMKVMQKSFIRKEQKVRLAVGVSKALEWSVSFLPQRAALLADSLREDGARRIDQGPPPEHN